MNEFRKWIRLFESDNDWLGKHIAELIETKREGDSYWLTPEGDAEACGTYTHSNFAYLCFGEGDEPYSEASSEQLWAQYGKQFPPTWPTHDINYEEVAMAHGYIRLIVAPKRKMLYINLIKGQASTGAKRLLMQVMNVLAPYEPEYVVEYTDGSSHGVNTTTSDARRLIGLLNAR